MDGELKTYQALHNGQVARLCRAEIPQSVLADMVMPARHTSVS